MATERRRRERKHIVYYLAVFDRTTEKLIGHVVDITPEGLMVMSEEPIEINKQYDLKIQLFSLWTNTSDIEFNATCVWGKPSSNIDNYESGFKIENISQNDIDTIKKLVEIFGFEH